MYPEYTHKEDAKPITSNNSGGKSERESVEWERKASSAFPH